MRMSKWWKVDFHVHTPASRDYKENGVTPKSWLKAAMEQNLDAVVVADHNSGEWIDKLYAAYDEMKRENAEGFRELTIFPGFELSVAGEPNRYHLLCVFDPLKRTQNLTACLGECGIRDGFGDEEQVSTLRGLEDIVHSVYNHGGLLIPAHVNGDKGLIGNRTTLTPDLEKALNYFVAAEFCNPPAYTDGNMKQAVKRLAILGGSDAHVTRKNSGSGVACRNSWIGKHYVWVKMGSPAIDALRMALSDPLDCVRSDGPAPEGDFRLLNLSAMNLADATRSPYCEDFACDFSPAMTAFIGGRGTGKSTVARCIRDVFCRPPESGEDSDIMRQWQSYRESTSASTLKIEFMMLGRRYRLTKQGPSEERLEEYGDGGWVESALGDVKSRFPISVFGQKEVGELASRPHGLLALIDEAGDTKGGGWKDEWDRCASEYLSLRIRERELEQQVELLPAVKVELADVERNISDYERMGGGNVLKTFQCRSRQDSAMSVPDVIGGPQGWAAQIRALADKFVVPDFPGELFADDDSTLSEIQSVYERYAEKLKGLLVALKNCANGVDAIIDEYQAARDVTAWRQAYEAAVCAYKDLCVKNGGELHIEDYGSWVTKRNHLVERVRTLESGGIELAKTRSEALLNQKKLEDLRESLRRKRQVFIDGALRSNSLVKMTVRKFADRSQVEFRLRKVLNVSNDWQAPAIKDMLAAIMKWDPKCNGDDELALKVSELKDKIHSVIRGSDSVTVWFDRKVKELWAANPSAFDEFDVWWPEDHVEVEYSMDDGTGFRPLSAGASAGQKATAMLAFLLSYGTNPILIDQPEDDIDNRLITKLLVQQLRENKYRRQVIVMTHNPNVVVNGGAESVAVMNFANGKVSCECQGPIDCPEIKKDICDIMEGGREAFRKRYERELCDVD